MPLRRFTTAELVLTQRAQLEWPLLVMVLLGAGGVALAMESQLYLGITLLAVLINALALRQRLEVYVPRWLVNAGVLVATGYFLYEFMRLGVIPALGHYLTLILICKLFEQKRNRDYGQIMAISLVLMLAGGMTTDALWFALLLAAYLPVACYVSMLLSLKLSLDRQAAAVLAVESRPIDPQKVAWNVTAVFPRRHLWLRAATGAGGCLLVAVLVYMLMPRVTPGLIAPLAPAATDGSVTGFSEYLNLLGVGRIQQDRGIVMRVRLSRDRLPITPAHLTPYLRSVVHGAYVRGEWLPWHDPGPYRFDGDPGGEGVLVQEVEMELTAASHIFAVAPVIRLELPLGATVMSRDSNLKLENRPLEGPMRYNAYSWLPPFEEWQLEQFNGLPFFGPAARVGAVPAAMDENLRRRLADLARQWCGNLPELPADWLSKADQPVDGWKGTHADLALAMADRIQLRLQSDYSYTLDLSERNPNVDPVEDFLFTTRKGHCGFFASAMTLLCRSVHVHARVVGGMLPGEFSGGQWVVRNSDAHAWVEVYTPKTDWKVYDPTAASSRPAPPRDLLTRLRDGWESAGFTWRTRVLAYSESSRQSLFGWGLRVLDRAWQVVSHWAKALGRSLWSFLRHGQVDERLLTAGLSIVAGLGLVLVGVMGVSILRRRRRRGEMPAGRVPAFYRRLYKLLGRHGLSPHPHETEREFLRHAAGQLRLPVTRLAAFAELLYQIRWAKRELPAAVLAEAEQSVRKLADELKLGS